MSTLPAPRPHDAGAAAGTFASIAVGEIMHAGVVSCAPDAPLSEVARLMLAHRVHAVVVGEPGGEPATAPAWSVISDLDVAAAGERAPEPAAVDVAAAPPVVVRTRDTLRTAVRAMREHHVHHLVVVAEEDPRPVGVLSSLDVAGIVAGERPRAR
jgi:CBS domain-containing protein